MSTSITIEDLYTIKFLSKPRISPDGAHVAFVATTIDERKHAYHASICVAPTSGGEAKRFTSGAANAHSPSWSPDGRWLAFVSDREGESAGMNDNNHVNGKAQQWLIPAHGRERHQ